MKGFAGVLVGLLLATAAAGSAQSASAGVGEGAGRFLAVHGERALVMGRSTSGLEVWAYPLQLLSDYRVRFLEAGRVEPLDASALLTRTEYGPSQVVRVYSGPDFVVRERLFTPLHEAAAVITYEVEGAPVRIEARFRPSLNLMWPGALGGQSVGWDAALNGYVEREPLHGFAATIRSAQAVEHDSTVNAAGGRDDGLALVMEPRSAGAVRRATLVVTSGDRADGLEARLDALGAEAVAHYERLAADEVRITTPDPALDRALADAQVALDQAWVCAPDLGCGEVAGYGPSRPERRPQYAWYFAGDGLVAVEGLLAAQNHTRAREELAFIARRQNTANGMIWHELSLSAPLIDWEKRYPYMFVHVDITLQYLSTLAQYVETTGDRAFLREHWAGVRAAYRYARSLVDPATGLPVIPAGKEGQNEQARLRDDVRLSSAWIDAADGFATLARLADHAREAAEAQAAARKARAAVAADGWDAAQGFWLGGHTEAGAAVHDARSDGVRLLQQGVFTPAQQDAALDRLASPDFQTDWGVRSLSRRSPDYDPNAYSLGAVWAQGTSAVASAFWDRHRPLAAWGAWRGLEGWNTLDSPGHLHEVLAGDLFHPEVESVPEQTWSSASLLTGMIHGLLGLQVRSAERRVAFAPHLPAEWVRVKVERVRVGASRLSLEVTRTEGATVLTVVNEGPAASVDFDPEIPLGARLASAEVDGRPRAATLEIHPQDRHARLAVDAGPGVTRAVIRYAGGVAPAPLAVAPQVGDHSRNLKGLAASWSEDGRLNLRAAVGAADRAQVDLLTALKIKAVEGGSVEAVAPGHLRLTLTPAAAPADVEGYVPAAATVTFAPEPAGAAPASGGGGKVEAGQPVDRR